MEDDLLCAVNIVRALFRIIFKSYPAVKSILFPGEKQRRKSIVRKIGTWLPLPHAPRVHINIPDLTLCPTPCGSFYEDDYLPPMRGDHSSFCMTILTPRMSSTPETHRAKINVLEKQLHDLQLQVAQILEQMPTSDYGSMVSVWLANQPTLTPSPLSSVVASTPHAAAPPLPPPLPPPMPPQDYLQSTPVRIKRGKRGAPDSGGKRSPASLLGDVIKQIASGRPQLKPVKRSPGGNNPLRTPKLIADPADILARVLRRRFAAIHSTSDTEVTESEDGTDYATEIVSSPASAV